MKNRTAISIALFVVYVLASGPVYTFTALRRNQGPGHLLSDPVATVLRLPWEPLYWLSANTEPANYISNKYDRFCMSCYDSIWP